MLLLSEQSLLSIRLFDILIWDRFAGIPAQGFFIHVTNFPTEKQSLGILGHKAAAFLTKKVTLVIAPSVSQRVDNLIYI